MPIIDINFRYLDFERQTVLCRLRVFEPNSWSVLVVTELAWDQEQVCITDSIERIATAAVRRFALDPARLVVIQHHDRFGEGHHHRVNRRIGIGCADPEAFALVRFEWKGHTAHSPQWTGISRQEAEVIIGEPLC
jgi:hypothetical protein